MRASLVALALIWAGCSFTPEGVPLEGDPPDAEVCVETSEVCDGLDNDCDGTTDEGVSSGAACDGDDADLCEDDSTICDSSGAEVCSSGEDNAELCNAADDDCDNNMDEGFVLAMACDSDFDGDACPEGSTVCAVDGLSTTCNDMTDTILEVCDGDDDDCDLVPDDGFDFATDEDNCGECLNACTNPNGSTMCTGGDCMPTCTNGYADCNGDPDDGCDTLQDSIANITAGCLGTTLSPDFTISGDVADTEVVPGTVERLMRIRVSETDAGDTQTAITARFALVSGAGTDFDLFVYCKTCGVAGLNEPDNTIDVGRDDMNGVNRTFDVFVEVRYDATVPSTTCAPWSLTITGNPTSPAVTDRCGN